MLALSYLILNFYSGESLILMAMVVAFWGGMHTSGLVVTQVWLTSSAADAHTFATSLYVSSANAGVVVGSFLGGVVIKHFGMSGAIACGVALAFASLLTILTKAAVYKEDAGSTVFDEVGSS
ncbi:MFS transporter [Pseudomonas aeruginosa]|uniref:MFS transporter n=1 Tax=Pseudomonas aeruginosa TaxID=287 RepID=UPI0018E000D4|nr:MFS transporter [Pseudomonas aeruginosa]QPZ62270.1 MFS transporter [Pseudomonas aeruginosa]HBO3954698.1 MFS transporter [Pseudomonas aeruginosa]